MSGSMRIVIFGAASIAAVYGQDARLPFNAAAPAAAKQKPIEYFGGPILPGAVPVYLIYYGNSGSFPATTPAIVNDFFSNLGGSAQYNVNTTYYDAQGNYVSNALSFSLGNVLYMNPTLGNSLSSKEIEKAVGQALAQLPVDPTAVYFLITAPDVKVAGFCNSYCAYHTHSAKIATGVDIKYAVVPEPDQRCTYCDGNVSVFQQSISPNGDLGADEMTDSIMHELSETVTDPDFNAWHTKGGAEAGDLCNFTYGKTYLAPNGAVANAHLGQRDYLIQTIWENTGSGFCANTLP